MKLSPMMEQYMSIKDQYDDCILFFRLGDFYEMFFEDAKLVSRLLELTLTGRNCGLKERAPMCGVPFHSADSYIERLVKMGYKVAICEQLEDPETTKGMVERGVVKIVTPGTLSGTNVLDERENNYLASVYLDASSLSLSYCDITTGELYVTEIARDSFAYDDLINELVRINASELIVNESFVETYDREETARLTGAFITVNSDLYCGKKAAEQLIKAQFRGLSLTAVGLSGREASIMSTAFLLTYLRETQMQDMDQITSLSYYEQGNYMSLDKSTLRNLEITETLFERKREGSLLNVLDKTLTAMGGRKLKRWITEPLNSSSEINARLDAVESLSKDPLLLNNIRESLKQVYDFERLIGRIASGNANGRDLTALAGSFSVLPEIKGDSKASGDSLLGSLSDSISDFDSIRDKIETAIVEEPPFTVKEGGLIRSGYSSELDELKDSIKDAKDWISGLEGTEKERTGITHLKVGYNKVFGYYIEVSRSNLDLVPEDYIRKQTLVGAERFITPKLKEMESIVLNAETKINKLEYQLFSELREEIKLYIDEIQKTSRAVSSIDVLCSYAVVSGTYSYVKPKVDDSFTIEITEGRHPVIEQTTEKGMFVPNDTFMNTENSSMLLITGPNMSGKSTYMRQTALIVLMAQAGCFVPASSARIGVCDRIFTRIGASDNLSRGESTFYVEMSELAYILRNAEARSLVILDEIGRGTSTYDGLSIAWATCEYLCNNNTRIRTLFATHYHEMTALGAEEGIVNLNVDVSEEHGEIVFLHKIVSGPASRSYGIHVADLAGVPKTLLEEAQKRLEILEETGVSEAPEAVKTDTKEEQISFFAPESPAVDKLRKLDLMEVKPSDAIRILEELKELIDD